MTNDPNHLIVYKVDENDHKKILTGANYDLYYVSDVNGNAVNKEIVSASEKDAADESYATWSWNGDEGVGYADRLTAGTYKLVETKSPYGYIIAEDIYFTMDVHGVVRINDTEVATNDNGIQIIYAEDALTEFSFTKLERFNESCAENADAVRAFAGAEFTAFADAELQQALMSVVSDENGLVKFVGLPLGTVYIKETATSYRHVLDENIYVAQITSEGGTTLHTLAGEPVAENTLINEVIRVKLTFTKTSELDAAQTIANGHYGLYRDGELITTAVSDENGVVTFDGILTETEYVLKELEAPAGSYLSKNAVKIIFHRDKADVIQTVIIDDGEGTLTATKTGLIWKEARTVVSILKVDEYGKPLAGATLQIKDLDGNIIPVLNADGEMVDSWVSSAEAMTIVGQLEAGKTYKLVELQAPSGYKLAEDVEFTLDDTPVAPGENRIVEVIMVDELIPRTPDTGDTANPLFYLMTMLLSGIAVFFQLKEARKRKKVNG